MDFSKDRIDERSFTISPTLMEKVQIFKGISLGKQEEPPQQPYETCGGFNCNSHLYDGGMNLGP